MLEVKVETAEKSHLPGVGLAMSHPLLSSVLRLPASRGGWVGRVWETLAGAQWAWAPGLKPSEDMRRHLLAGWGQPRARRSLAQIGSQQLLYLPWHSPSSSQSFQCCLLSPGSPSCFKLSSNLPSGCRWNCLSWDRKEPVGHVVGGEERKRGDGPLTHSPFLPHSVLFL